jgi:hypothetical protein
VFCHVGLAEFFFSLKIELKKLGNFDDLLQINYKLKTADILSWESPEPAALNAENGGGFLSLLFPKIK